MTESADVNLNQTLNSKSKEISILESLDQENVCDDLFRELIQSGVDLRNYSQDVNKQLKKVENSCVHDYINESTNIARLHQQINESDQILEKIEGKNLVIFFLFIKIISFSLF